MADPDDASLTRPTEPATQLRPELRIGGATMMGLGSIIGTGVFVSIGIGAEVAGPAVILAIVVAALLATCNGLSSAQLAACHPVSGGTYEYGYRWLHPTLGFTAGWMFLCAKSASAASAALGFSGYVLHGLSRPSGQTILAASAVVVLTLLVLGGIRRSDFANRAIVSVTLSVLIFFVIAGTSISWQRAASNLLPFFAPVQAAKSPALGFLEACALMFVAFTGYGRIATLAEEVRAPRRTIPAAIVLTLLLCLLLYIAVAAVGVAAVGAKRFAGIDGTRAAPLENAAAAMQVPGLTLAITIGAATAMLGVQLNLVLGLSRVVLAMARRGDLPSALAQINGATGSPQRAVLLVGALITAVVCFGDVKTTWSFSAFTVLVYYAITNLAATRLTARQRLFPRGIAWMGTIACLLLAFWVERRIWLTGLIVIAIGLAWHWLRSTRAARPHIVGQREEHEVKRRGAEGAEDSRSPRS